MEQLTIINTVVMWMVIVANLLLTLALIRRINSMTPQRLKPLDIGQEAPDFTAETIEGESVTLATYQGRSTAFVFISPSCHPCREELPSLKALYPMAVKAGVELILVSVVEKDETKSFKEEMEINLPILIAPMGKNPFTQDYKTGGTPFYCMINANGKVEATGFLDEKWQKLKEEWGGDTLAPANDQQTVPAA